jgi:hypothetical protein
VAAEEATVQFCQIGARVVRGNAVALSSNRSLILVRDEQSQALTEMASNGNPFALATEALRRNYA